MILILTKYLKGLNKFLVPQVFVNFGISLYSKLDINSVLHL